MALHIVDEHNYRAAQRRELAFRGRWAQLIKARDGQYAADSVEHSFEPHHEAELTPLQRLRRNYTPSEIRSMCAYDFRLFVHLFCEAFFWGCPGIFHDHSFEFARELAQRTHRDEHGRLLRSYTMRLNRLAPRGVGKSTLDALCWTAWDILYSREDFIVFGSHDERKCNEMLANLRDLLGNEEIMAIYEPQVSRARVDLLQVNACHVLTRSLGQNWRGLNHNGKRPTRIIFDDIESEEMVYSLRSRESNWRTWLRAVEACANSAAHYCQTVFIGLNTPINEHCIANRLSLKPDFDTYIYPAVLQEPKNQAAWQVWDAIYLSGKCPPGLRESYLQAQMQQENTPNQGFPNSDQDSSPEDLLPGARLLGEHERLQLAMFYYRQNQSTLEAGLLLNWAEGQPYWAMRRFQLANGVSAYRREYLCDLSDVQAHVFRNYLLDEDGLTRPNLLWDIDFARNMLVQKPLSNDYPNPSNTPEHAEQLAATREIDLAHCVRFAYLDGAEGRSSNGCYAALAIVAHSERDSNGERCPSDILLDLLLSQDSPETHARTMLLACQRLNVQQIYIEASTFQGLYKPLFMHTIREMHKHGELEPHYRPHVLRVRPPAQHSRRPKAMHIEQTLIGFGFGRGRLGFARGLIPEFWSQLGTFPLHPFDDAPDALAGALYCLNRPDVVLRD